ncbi:hypothetical protein Acor_09360 [Acrocarpospora corrugata]|uniref:Peptidase MA-like domain-containing protein n=1 Tax=Acrocarpospora corrugata TaxID=35763 RepID=A0A5M3VUV6_9ACTN|nr:hypothetical protein [Acrocarpospora corrugata]GER98872.1 hypothetical protein Acor_09360 [Acrocarpospora corrugata]
MRVRLTAALLAAMLTALASASAPVDTLLAQARAIAREHPGIWADATIVRTDNTLVLIAKGAPLVSVAPAARPTDSAVTPAAPPTDSAVAPDAPFTDSAEVGFAFAGEVERARRAVTRVWALAGVVVLVPKSTEEAAVLAVPAGVRGMAALADVDHVIIEPGGFGRLSEVGRRVVLSHELTHVATGAAMSGEMPMWLIEGFADYVGYLDSGLPVRVVASELAEEVRAGVLPRRLPGRDAFGAGSKRLAQAYEEAWLACRYISERFGVDRLVELYRTARDGDPGTAVERTLGVSMGELTDGWRDYLRRRLVGPV